MKYSNLDQKIGTFIDRKTSEFPEIDEAADRLINEWR